MNEELGLMGMWDGHFWKGVGWTADEKSWIIPKVLLTQMLINKDYENDKIVREQLQLQSENFYGG
tara:strand:+ start:34405 stop:34599 length:195 start_codon:yes stop_codon:yes gene_type:complete